MGLALESFPIVYRGHLDDTFCIAVVITYTAKNERYRFADPSPSLAALNLVPTSRCPLPHNRIVRNIKKTMGIVSLQSDVIEREI
jgi:hypothetical protein